jgi:ABC-type branched-subunit amino acid transport system substrate-binding protein
MGCALPAVPDEVVLGASLPLTGPEADRGQAMARGYRRAADEVNRRGGVRLGAGDRRVSLRLDVRDDRGEAALAERYADELVDHGAVVLLSTAGAVCVATQAALAERVQRPYVLARSEAPGLPGRHADWTVSVVVEGDVEARAHALVVHVVDAIERAGVTDARAVRHALRATSG